MGQNEYGKLKAGIFYLFQCLVNFITNLFIKPKEEYELSAMVYKVIWAKTLLTIEASREKFIVLFEKFEHPSILLEDRYSLFSVSDSEAIFVDCGEKDVFDKNVAFSYVAQLQYAKKMVAIPISSFHLIANQVSIPKIPIINLGHHGRCGSTLASKIFNEIPNVLSISETLCFTNLVRMSREDGDAQYENLKKLCRSVILMTVKHANTRGSTCVFLKCQSYAIYIADMMFESFPEITHVFMYRQAEEFVRSWEKIFVNNNWDVFPTSVILEMGGVGKHRMMKDTQLLEFEYVHNLDFFSKFALLWISKIAAYKYLVKKGYKIKSLKYEHLLENPDQALRNLFEYVGLPLNKMPDIEKVMSKDSQAGTELSTRSVDREALDERLSSITDDIKADVENILKVYKLDGFWDNIILDMSILDDR